MIPVQKKHSITRRAVFGLVAVVLSGVVYAHHSNTPFDMSRMLEASGIVQRADFRNPHSLLTLLIENEGGTTEVTYEGHSLATLRHYGLLPSMVRTGDLIDIAYAPRRDDAPGGIFLIITTPAGETLDFSQLGYD